MKYERTTERRETPLVMSMWAGDSESLKVYNRLAELEDKIERGNWNMKDTTFKQIFDELRALGYEIVIERVRRNESDIDEH